ncbi:sigma-70 family RNA polymerase sigma factor [Emticicia sp. TH156]|uniref:sigma-70 family RNA polymerase sigma factor n=1 Tax=Emticicia sp. TH156 TaxID=2067454 RepID=UPI001304123F|nr:sigma-70 family RNA polymerase sigma factor [Emticicia sp. TH156]
MKTLCDVPVFWLANQEMVYTYIKRRVDDREIARDLTQEVLLKIYKFCFSQCGVKNTRAWLFDIAHNTIIDYYRNQKEEIQIDTFDISEEKEVDVYQSISEFIRPLLVCLPEKYATPLQLELDGVNQKEIADRLQLNLSATKSRIQRSKQMMKELMFECFDLELDSEGRVDSYKVKNDCQTLQRYLEEKYQHS